jgi:hypothetical protein
MDGEEVWVAETWGAHGEGQSVQGVYGSREAAWEGLKGKVDTLYIAKDGSVQGRPRHEESGRNLSMWGDTRQWASAYPMKVQGRAESQASPTGP